MDLSTRASINLSGPIGLSLLGASVSTDDIAHFGVVGNTWGFAGVRLTELTLSSLDHTLLPGTPRHYPLEDSASTAFVLDGTVLMHTPDAELHFGTGTGVVLVPGELPTFSCVAARVLLVTIPLHRLTTLAAPRTPSALSTSTIRIEPALAYYRALTQTVRTHSINADPTASIIVKLMNELIIADRSPWLPFEQDVIRLIRRAIASHYADNLFDPRALARLLGIPGRELDTVIGRQTLGERTADLIAEHRLVRAMTLLQPSTGHSVHHVAARSGYRTSNALESAVLQVYGINATALQASQQHRATTPTVDDGGPQQRLTIGP